MSEPVRLSRAAFRDRGFAKSFVGQSLEVGDIRYHFTAEREDTLMEFEKTLGPGIHPGEGLADVMHGLVQLCRRGRDVGVRPQSLDRLIAVQPMLGLDGEELEKSACPLSSEGGFDHPRFVHIYAEATQQAEPQGPPNCRLDPRSCSLAWPV